MRLIPRSEIWGYVQDWNEELLEDINVTFRRDPETGRPRANKPESRKDREQKSKGEYYYV